MTATATMPVTRNGDTFEVTISCCIASPAYLQGIVSPGVGRITATTVEGDPVELTAAEINAAEEILFRAYHDA